MGDRIDTAARNELAGRGFLAAFLGQDAVSRFWANHWRRRFLHLPGAAAPFMPLMPTAAEVDALLGHPAHDPERLVHVVSFPVSGVPIARSWALTPDAGGSVDPAEPINLPDAARHVSGLGVLADALSAEFGARSSLQLFRSPPRSGLHAHRDINDSFVIQIAGTKRWRCADVAPGRPLVDGNGSAELGGDATVVDLAPGDVLYKPSHAAHATTAGDEPSLSLTCSISTRTAADQLLDLLRARLAEDPVWLERLPLATAGATSDDDVARTRLAEALRALPDLLPSLDDLAGSIRR